MTYRLETHIGRLRLKNPVIAAAGEHLIDAAGIRSAILSGAGAVVGKSTNESQAARDQLTRAEYVALGWDWRPVPWGADAPPVTLLTRSGLHPLGFADWLAQCVEMDRLARAHDCLFVPSLILSEPAPAVDMARAIQDAGLRVLEFNIGTPYACPAAKGAVATEPSPKRVGALTAMMVQALKIPVWIKITGQSERVPDLARAAFDAGAESVVMAGRAPASYGWRWRTPGITSSMRRKRPISRTVSGELETDRCRHPRRADRRHGTGAGRGKADP